MRKIFSLFAFLSIFILTGCAPSDVRPALFKSTSQDATTYLDASTQNILLVPAAEQKKLIKEFYSHYFSPWNKQDRLETDIEIKQGAMEELTRWKKNPGWGDNELVYNPMWLDGIEENMDLATYPNHRVKGITITQANMRSLPTIKPVFSKFTYAPSGYPFDRLQSQVLPAGMPVLILQATKDKAWYLVQSHNNAGWVPSSTIKAVDDKFIHQWQTQNNISIVKNQISILDSDGHFQFAARAGSIYPLSGEMNGFYKILIPVLVNNEVVAKEVLIAKSDAVIMPLALTPYNVATILNQYIGYPYGWGEIYNYRDCSSTMLDVFTPFAIWLPRDSVDQAQAGKYISLAKMSNAQKIKMISSKGIPFFTLLSLPGHIVLYIGEKEGKLYIFHDVWSLHTWFKGQAMITQTVITPIDFGKQYINVPKSYIDHIQGMTIP